ncbi:arsenate reductase (glutaredoxin) [Halomonas alimentaria]|uniref:Arsenate reductase n=1 Tax=Halomonas alimentaria TaxID=147248 RepID=A0A7X4W5Y3_9GAMM|nr:arsenate reductase (glutaredoxin) [Halomonas alimentaria]NAW34875.1 arsenate reductase (glutaredoxin) [Halomonas alimentaria]
MTRITLLHNPRCSKSRQALALLEERGVEVAVRRYLDEPLDEAELRALIDRLEGGVERLVRTKEAEWKALAADASDPEQVIGALLAHPRIMERPIADDGQRAVIGRPPEDILALLA